ncbi:MAG: hypothetical protein E7265_06390 [Lachnospiraceae bacterium]|nr:hypothetical protein [Lachnospiraceae bacterium]
MGEEKINSVDVYEFENRLEYQKALREYETICNLDKKMNLGDPKVALSLYNQAVTKKTFKTVVGYAFLKKLRDSIIISGIVDDDSLKKVPVRVENSTTENRVGSAGSRKSGSSAKRDESSQNEAHKKTKTVLSVAVVALIAIIIGMFVITFNSKYSYLTYFTDYENDIRESIINEYEEWEKELETREQALKDNK